MLTKFHEEYEEMTKSLYDLLRKGEAVHIQDLKSILKNIHSKQMNRSNEVRKKLNEFRKEREDTELKRINLFINTAHIRATN